MSLAYRAIDWNRQKRLYDLTLLALVGMGLGVMTGVSVLSEPNATAETLIIRGTAVMAFALLHVILAIGPLARLDPRFLPFLYNRRHLGVTMFLLALVHAVFSAIQFHAFGDRLPWVSVLTAYQRDYLPWSDGRLNLAHFPFEPFGVLALVLLFFMAATSHDFWLRNLGAPFWKTMHLGVYVAYGSLLVHVALGYLQTERHPWNAVMVGVGASVLIGLHVTAARKERRKDAETADNEAAGFSRVCLVDSIEEGVGKVVRVAGRRLAVWKHRGRCYATSNVCRHQGGPLGEGRILDGCITCPWHGWNYQPEDGCSPPPFQEVIATYPTRVSDGWLWVGATPHPPRSRSEGAHSPSVCERGGEAANE